MAKSKSKPRSNWSRRKLLIANWKLNLNADEAVRFARALKARARAARDIEVVIAPSFVNIPPVARVLTGSGFKVGAQNVAEEERGAFTGEVSAPMLLGLAEYVIVGHSERRRFFHESDQQVARKLALAVSHGLTAVLAVGETLAEREAGHSERKVSAQLAADLSDLTAAEVAKLAIAYEPIWAIGTGRECSRADAELMARHIRSVIESLYGESAAAGVRVLYGGSVTAEDVEAFATLPDIDGVLVGGASIHIEEWLKILKVYGLTVKPSASKVKSGSKNRGKRRR